MKHFINLGLLLFFSTLVVTAVMAFLLPFSLTTTRVHIIFGSGTLVLVGLHLAWRVQYFRRALAPPSGAKRSVPLSVLGGVVGLWGVMLGASLWNWAPAEQFIELGYEARHRAAIFRPSPQTQYQALGDQMRLKHQGRGDSSLLVELEWGEAFPARFKPERTGPFGEARPQIAIWTETTRGSLIETLFVSEKAAFAEQLEWGGHELDRVDILPVWRHRYTLKTGVGPDGEVAIYSGATPEHAFSLHEHLATDGEPFYLYVEINAPGDENEFFHSNQPHGHSGHVKPGLGQPSVIYGAYLVPREVGRYTLLDLVAHGGGSAARDGNMRYDLEHLTSARQLIEKILVRVELLDETDPDQGKGMQANEENLP